MKLTESKIKYAGVVGMGRSGTAAIRLLTHLDYFVIAFDSSPAAVCTMDVKKTVFGDFTDTDLKDVSVLVLSPGVATTAKIVVRAKELNIPVISEVELACRNTSSTLLAITGSNGKTTTVEWLTHVINLSSVEAEAVAAGNMGYALSDAILDNPLVPVFVVELSSYQLETTTGFHATSSVILNLTPDHLVRHGTMENYGETKARIFLNQNIGDTAILNFDDTLLEKYRNISGGKQLYFSLKQEVPAGAWMDETGYLCYKDETQNVKVIHSDKLALQGKHNIANALAVICLAVSYGIPVKKMISGLIGFKGVAHRIEPLGSVRGLYWFNDSKSTNVDSLKVALESFQNKVILIAGGKEKDTDYSVLNQLIKHKVKNLVLFGSGAELLSKQWQGAADIHIHKNLEDSVEGVLKLAESGDTVLLSPGCASFDQYSNFEERGDHFKSIVQALKC